MDVNSFIISLGSNSSDSDFQIEQAIDHLCQHFDKCEVSSIYETQDVKNSSVNYLNTVVHGYTTQSQDEVAKFLKEWEEANERTLTEEASGLVNIDLDLVVWNGRIIRQNDFMSNYFNRGYRELLEKGVLDIL